MLTNHLKEITYPGRPWWDGGQILIYGPGRAADIRNPRYVVKKRLITIRSRHIILACLLDQIKGYRVMDASFISWGRVSSITNVKKNDLPLYISWGWKSELFDTLLQEGL